MGGRLLPTARPQLRRFMGQEMDVATLPWAERRLCYIFPFPVIFLHTLLLSEVKDSGPLTYY